MNLDTHVSLKVHDESNRPMLEIINAEKQLWSLIYLKGLLHKEAEELYVKVCLKYEKIILSDHEEVEFQELEYSLWKLHYKHIHEFRKRISQSSISTGCTESNVDSHVEKYKSFLTEATEFYQNLISKVGKYYGFEEMGGVPSDPVKWHKCQYSCHRYLVCLGDLARYTELCKNLDVPRRNWSVAANYYFKAVSSWSDSGNPQNKLAVLAKYIGDDFLALYHCIRSLAVKEPFPDARNNLILLLEENRSSHLESLSREAHFNFSNPLERSAPPSAFDIKNNEMQAADRTSSTKSGLWSLFVRMISLFFVESSSEEFSYTFASTMSELDVLLELNDIKLSGSLESYQHMDPDRTGPYRALQLVSILIFTVDSLTTTSDNKESKENINLKQPNLVKSVFTATFTILGRVIERCLNGNLINSNPLLPAVLVFVEWLNGMLDIVQKYVFQDEVAYAVSYFLDTFVEFLNQFETRGKPKNQNDIALWEDFELRGFAPMASSHKLLNFFTHEEPTSDFVGGDTRVHRIFDTAIKIVEKSPTGFRKWIFYDTEREKFFTHEQPSSVNLDLKEPQQTLSEVIKEKELITKRIAIEDEEEIIFKPLQRYNSAPIYSSEIETSTESVNDKIVLSDDSLRRATSLFSPPYPSGPPSLNAWVFDKESIESIDGERENTAIDFFKPRLSPIDEMGSLSLIDSPPYSAPTPSAPLLPADAILLFENSAIHDMNSPMSDTSTYTNRSVCYEPSNFTPMSNTSTYTNRSVCYEPSNFTPLSSSEWLQQFRNPNINMGNYLVQPIHHQTPANFDGNVASRLPLINWYPSNPNQIMHPEIPRLYPGSELGFLADGLKRKNLNEIPTLLYVKEKEWQLQNQAQGRGFAYMGD